MDFHFSDPQTVMERVFGGNFYINAVGTINAGDDDKFKRFLETHEPPPRLTVYIDSTGGNVEAAISIGRIIRDSWFSCSVGRYEIDAEQPSPEVFLKRTLHPGQCLSAATLLLLGGRLRYFENDSTFGVHQFSFKDPTPAHIGYSQELSAKISSYVYDMGISLEFLEISAATTSDKINRITKCQLQKLGVITDGETEATWTVQSMANQLYVRGERDSLYGHHKVMLCYRKPLGFLFWAVIESQGREGELINNGLVDISVNNEEILIDISNRCHRVPSNAYVNIVSELTEEEARVIAYSENFGVRVRVSQESPMFLGVGEMSTEGGQEQLQSFFEVLCER